MGRASSLPFAARSQARSLRHGTEPTTARLTTEKTFPHGEQSSRVLRIRFGLVDGACGERPHGAATRLEGTARGTRSPMHVGDMEEWAQLLQFELHSEQTYLSIL